MRAMQSLFAFNRGVISRLGLARMDIKRLALAAQVQTNYIPRVLGSMMLRPGLGFLGSISRNKASRMVPFIFSTVDTSLIELTDQTMRIWANDVLLTRNAVSTTLTNGSFATNLSGWTTSLGSVDCSVTWLSAGNVGLIGDGTLAAQLLQTLTVANPGAIHGLAINVAHGPISIRIGSAAGLDDIFSETVLNTGNHSLGFVPPAGKAYLQFLSRQLPVVTLGVVAIEGAGPITVPAPWIEADMQNINYDQSADVIFVACKNYQQRRIERRDNNSWSVVRYLPLDGPFNVQNTTPTSLTPQYLQGNCTLTASKPLFNAQQVGALFSHTSVGQAVQKTVTAQNVWSDPIKVTGSGSDRLFFLFCSGLVNSTVSLEFSLGVPGNWEIAPNQGFANGIGFQSNGNQSYIDGLDNQIVYYRIGVANGQYGSDTISLSMTYPNGSICGICRVTSFVSTTVVNVEVLTPFGNITSSTVWEEGQWSDYRGWPTCVAFHDGRLCWSGKGYFWASISDSFDSFDETFAGDAGPLQRSIGSGPLDVINFMLSMQRLLLGSDGAEYSIYASSVDSPITPSDFILRAATNQGSAAMRGIKLDQRALFINRSGVRLYELTFSFQLYNYAPSDATNLNPDILKPGVVRMDACRQPDTRIFCVRSDGVCATLVSDVNEEVSAWVLIETQGTIEDVVCLPALPGQIDDQVYFVVKRTINGSTVRYLEKLAQESECQGNMPLCKLADSFISQTLVAPNTIVGNLSNLEGQEVVVWADGQDIGTNDAVLPWQHIYKVTNGQIVLNEPAQNIVVGLPYTAQFQSMKLGQAMAGIESPLNQKKRINHLGLILADTHTKGLQFGPEFDYLDDMPSIEGGASVTPGVNASYDEVEIEFPGQYTTDLRVCIQSVAPRPCTILGLTMDLEVNK